MIFLNIGSNLDSSRGDRLFNLKKTIELISLNNIKIVKISSIYETPSYPNKKNPKFLNIGLNIESDHSPFDLIKILGYFEILYPWHVFLLRSLKYLFQVFVR